MIVRLRFNGTSIKDLFWHLFSVEQPSVTPGYLEQPSRVSVEEPEFEFDDETGLELEAHDGNHDCPLRFRFHNNSLIIRLCFVAVNNILVGLMTSNFV